MNRPVILLSAAVVFVMAIATAMLGWNLILPLPTMQLRGGGGPWYVTWAMVWITVLCAVWLGGFLIASTTTRKK